MVDLHTHIIPGIDDGAIDMDTALQMLHIAQSDGTRHILLTPHFIHGDIDNNVSKIKEKYTALVDKATSETPDLKLYTGSEVFICPQLPDLLDAGVIATLNDTSYVLVELPMSSFPDYTIDVFYRLKLKGFNPILAHPERNMAIAKNPDLLTDLIERGVLAQINSTSVTGLFGKRTRELAMQLIKHNMAHFVSSDAHTCRGRAPRLSSARSVIAELYGENKVQELFENNGLAVLNNEQLDIPEPVKIRQKRRLWSIAGLFNL